jgi:UPF0176 protein
LFAGNRHTAPTEFIFPLPPANPTGWFLRFEDYFLAMTTSLLILSCYHFADLPDYRALREPWLARARALGLKGSILLASEGLNATLCGAPLAVREFVASLQQDPRLAGLRCLEMPHSGPVPFGRMQIRLKSEIIRMNVPAVAPATGRGQYVRGQDWDALLADPDTLVIDTRNAYEVALGTFQGAVNPGLRQFSELPGWLDDHIRTHPPRRVAMFCTGGIRCEKSTAYLRQQGLEEVYHLEGGILGYLQETGNAAGLWQGDCFVFDGRFAVNDQVQPAAPVTCRVCTDVLLTEDLEAEAGHRLVCRACTPPQEQQGTLFHQHGVQSGKNARPENRS